MPCRCYTSLRPLRRAPLALLPVLPLLLKLLLVQCVHHMQR